MTKQIKMPYAEVADKAGARQARQLFSRAGDIFKIPIDKVEIRTGFNARQKPDYLTEDEWEERLEIKELAEAIFLNSGPMDPLKGDVTKSGKFIVSEGERRTRAILYLLKTNRTRYPNGDEVGMVKCILHSVKITELEKALELHNQQKMPLTPVQKGRLYLRYSEVFGLTHDEIADKVGVSRQTVDNMVILVTRLPEETIRAVEDGMLPPTKALERYRAQQKAEKKNRTIIKVDESTGEVIDDNEETEDDDDDSNENPNPAPVIVDTKAAEKVEEQSHKTNPKTTDQLERKLKDDQKEASDAMQSIDFKPDKELGEMELNQMRKNNDKIYNIASKLPANLQQYAKDIMQFVEWNNNGIDKVQEILKKASDTR